MTHTIEDYDGEATDGHRGTDGRMTDVMITSVLVLEAVNFALLAYILRWTVKAGNNVVGKIAQAIGLRQGKNPSIGDRLRSLKGPALPTVIDNNGGGGGNVIDIGGGQQIDLDRIDLGKVEGLIGNYLGSGKATPAGADLAQKFMQGKMGKGDIVSAIPFFLDLLKAPQAQNGQAALPNYGERW